MQIPSLNDFKRTFDDPVWYGIADLICERHGIAFTNIRRAEHAENMVFLVDDAFVLKIYTPLKNGFNREKAALEFAEGKIGIPIPSIVNASEIEGFYYLIITQLEGRLMTREEWLSLKKREQIGLLEQLASELKKLHSSDSSGFQFDWSEFLSIQIDSAVDKQREDGANPKWIESLPSYLDKYLPLLPDEPVNSFQHGDVHFGNLRVLRRDDKWQFSGLFDFTDSIIGFHEYEFVAVGVLMMQGQGDLQREFFRAYGYKDNEIDLKLRRRMMLLTILYEYSSLRRYAIRLRPEAMNYTLEELERAIWDFT